MKIKVHLSIGYVGAEHEEVIEINSEEIEGMNQEQIDEYITEEYLVPWMWNYVDLYHEIIE